jgi:hypothetical protein
MRFLHMKTNLPILLCAALFLAAGWLYAEKPQLARMNYDGGGDWYNDPDLLPNLAQYLNVNLHTDFSSEQATVKVSDPKLLDYPFVFMTGHGNVRFSDKEIDNLRAFFANGGFLYADDDYGMDESFRRELRRVFPDRQLAELPATHPLFECFNSFPRGLPKIHQHDDKRPQALAIFDDYGRMLVLYTYESNISDGWAGPAVHNDPPPIRDQALRMGANLFYYLMTR